jgi:hypothetical protein
LPDIREWQETIYDLDLQRAGKKIRLYNFVLDMPFSKHTE